MCQRQEAGGREEGRAEPKAELQHWSLFGRQWSGPRILGLEEWHANNVSFRIVTVTKV